jgi:hypothetical protein
MLYREVMAVCSEIHTRHINTLCGQNVEFVNVKPGGTYSNHWAFRDDMTLLRLFSFTFRMAECHSVVLSFRASYPQGPVTHC